MASSRGRIARLGCSALQSLPLRPQPSPAAPLTLPQSTILPTLIRPQGQIRCISANEAKYRKNKTEKSGKKKKKARTHFKTPDLRQATQFSLCDAMRYIRAFEAGQEPTSAKYDVHVRLRTVKNGPVVRNQLRLPHPVRTDLRVCVICPEDSPVAEEARAAGATVVGEASVFELVKKSGGRHMPFERCIAHPDSVPALQAAGVARILGPRGLMPNAKHGTIVREIGPAVRMMVGGTNYRERAGVIRMAVGQLGFSPEELSRNIKAYMGAIQRDIRRLSEDVRKDVHEVVLSSTHAPGFSLNGELVSGGGTQPEELPRIQAE
ncbi:ribosomal protein L1-like protein [Lineolata rhizophorae]|uniref:Ribosomal protein L1-like protein n=1 Tax=Lineolata rhizophorae TaxID=578093 RepID=A0A6A6NVE1_9PEZI|nr:ribosomal protein L1-like protein [Lineolata rhizophorae]